jgi:NMD protein affecting ribosome stability and mRNA decay
MNKNAQHYVTDKTPLLTAEVIESIGECALCGHIDLLGNGLCADCWDKDPPNVKPPKININPPCVRCAGTNTCKRGVYISKENHPISQRYWCKDCNKRWSTKYA